MKIAFVGGNVTGGAGMSHREFVNGFEAAEHATATLVRATRFRDVEQIVYGQLLARSRQRFVPRRLGGSLLAIATALGRRPTRAAEPAVGYWSSPVPENAFRWLHRRFEPDVVVVRSMRSRSIREIAAFIENQRLPWAYHVAEALAIDQLLASGARPNVVVATARTHQRRLEAAGLPSVYIPQMRRVDDTIVESSRRVVLMVNATRLLGVDVFWGIAAACPHIEFVLQESWPLAPSDMAELRRRGGELGNVTVRAHQSIRTRLYEDARILLAPHQVDNNPRVAIEAQANGIPVLASDWPGLLEVVGDGGILVPPDAPIAEWAQALKELWDDEAVYESLCATALRNYREDPDNDGDRTVQLYLSLLDKLVNEDASVVEDFAALSDADQSRENSSRCD